MHYILEDTQFQTSLKILVAIKYIHTTQIKNLRNFILIDGQRNDITQARPLFCRSFNLDQINFVCRT